MLKNVDILEFGNYIWNHHEKCIEMSTNICLEICETKQFDGETNGRVQSIKSSKVIKSLF